MRQSETTFDKYKDPALDEKCRLFPKNHGKKEPRGHEVLNNRANMNCVISSSPTTGLRTTHLLRSILFRAPTSHAIPADSTLCLHPHFNIKFGHNSSFRLSTATLSRRRNMFHRRDGNPRWISCGSSVLRADAVEFTCCHVDDETLMVWKSVYCHFHQQSPRRRVCHCAHGTFIFLLPLFFTLLTTAPRGFNFSPFHSALEWL